jgi:hypothetical protein
VGKHSLSSKFSVNITHDVGFYVSRIIASFSILPCLLAVRGNCLGQQQTLGIYKRPVNIGPGSSYVVDFSMTFIRLPEILLGFSDSQM